MSTKEKCEQTVDDFSGRKGRGSTEWELSGGHLLPTREKRANRRGLGKTELLPGRGRCSKEKDLSETISIITSIIGGLERAKATIRPIELNLPTLKKKERTLEPGTKLHH